METPVKRKKLTLTVPEAAELLGVSKSKMYEIVRMEGFPCIRFGSRVLINANKLEDWVNEVTKGWYCQL